MTRRTNSGFIALPALAWGAIGAVVVILGLGIALKVQSARLESCQADRVKLEAQAKVLGAQIAEQNRAVEKLASEGVKKAKEAAKALRRAEGRAQVWADNAARLRAVLTATRPAGEAVPTSCEAAWQEIRK